MRSLHQDMVRQFMMGAKQSCPDTPVIPSESERLLRAKLILEEALETITGLGFAVEVEVEGRSMDLDIINPVGVEFRPCGDPFLEGIADGCADIMVVATGTLCACGIKDTPLLYEVDCNNLLKLKKGTLREDGKLIKPPDHQPPDIAAVLKSQGWEGP